ncbi:winged helix-turn-helix domain-containing protein [Aurantiacibacter spongiae]|uniref:ArsR family transcriptional regulator n=1 Tax=Aurantiacibacter spongiae TaxID=2488860 RepID=A0A3N5D7I8_9SPHN|nr:transcriptional regulator [Aurantiacibacter spongiae]RPF70508.1 ArsR family transcriptional regulator [Aurantiacibacter spongiae]
MSVGLDEMFNASARLQIAAILLRADEAEFSVIRDVIEVSDSALSKHLSTLSEAGYVSIKKAPRNGRQRTWAALTSKGRRAFQQHVKALQEMIMVADEKIGDTASD